ncbi:MAG: TadE family protein [Actinomycetota bacterium]
MRTVKKEDGTAAVELVLVAPALILLLAVIVGSGRVVSTKSAVLSAAREAARAAAEAPDVGTARSVALARAREVASGFGLDPARLSVQQTGSFDRGSAYEVRVSYRVQLSDLPAFGILPGSFAVTARHTELTERYKSR